MYLNSAGIVRPVSTQKLSRFNKNCSSGRAPLLPVLLCLLPGGSDSQPTLVRSQKHQSRKQQAAAAAQRRRHVTLLYAH